MCFRTDRRRRRACPQRGRACYRSDVPHVDAWIDYSSPFAYLGASRIEALAKSADAELVWKPMLLGGVFKAIGQADVPLFAASEAKQQYLRADMRRWADFFGIAFEWPRRFPMNSVLALRVTMLLDDPVPFIHRVFRAYWAEGRDIDDPTVLQQLLGELGADRGLVEGAARETR